MGEPIHYWAVNALADTVCGEDGPSTTELRKVTCPACRSQQAGDKDG